MQAKLWLLAAVCAPAAMPDTPTTPPACADVRQGTFHMVSPYGTSVIKRDAQYQVETMKEQKLETRYRVHWKDDCTYQLTVDKRRKGPAELSGKPGDTLTVHILSVRPESYDIEISSNFHAAVLKATVLRGK